MANPYNGSNNGNRGGSKHRSSRKPFREPNHKEAAAGIVANGSKGYTPAMFECYQEETVKDHLIPRKSLTEKQHLGMFVPEVEFEQMKPTRRLQKDTSGNWVNTSDPRFRVAWKGDTTLLRRGKPDNFGEGKNGTVFKRETAHTKEIEIQIERKETPIDPENPTTFGGFDPNDHDDILETI